MQDKELRKIVTAHVVNDIKRINIKTKNIKINTFILRLIQNILKTTSHEGLAKRCLQILIQCYKKQILTDKATINTIANAALLNFPKLSLIACFFLMETTEFPDFSDSESEEDFNFSTLKNSKKTRSKQARIERQ